MNLYNDLCSITGEKNVLRDELMSGHTTFRIGGPADYFVMPSSADEIRKITALCTEQEIPYYIIGNGSNLLVGDKGYRGVIIQVFKNMRAIETDGVRVCLRHSGHAGRRGPHECRRIRRRDQRSAQKC